MTARIILDIPPSEVGSVREALLARAPTLEVREVDAATPEGWADCLLTWSPAEMQIKQLASNGFIQAYGAGVDRIFQHPALQQETPVVRIVDDRMSFGMAQFVALSVLRFIRSDETYREQQARRIWQRVPHPNPADWPIGILGLGALGTSIASALEHLGLVVHGWRRRDAQRGNFSEFLNGSRILICLLPLTEETRGFVDRKLFFQLPEGAYFVSCGRGAVIVESDLIAALHSGHIAGAALDVFENEPLPSDHPFWTMPGVAVTPHIATFPIADAVAEQMLENIRRLKNCEPLRNVADRTQGY